MQEYKRIEHTLDPWADDGASVLILGTLPSPKSRESGSYYGHPQNRFWKVLAMVYGEEEPQTVSERRIFVKAHHLALWDVLASCEIRGADDASIHSPVPNKVGDLCKQFGICAVFTTGQKAKKLYDRYLSEEVGLEAIALPSTSPANCRWYTVERLVEEYRLIAKYTAR